MPIIVSDSKALIDITHSINHPHLLIL
ncbi:MAG: CRISPR-associated DxTHG motif protein [Clostridium butyricum]|nr:CRISPR-associated DxTHG motif protein [Clostridium butyricum]